MVRSGTSKDVKKDGITLRGAILFAIASSNRSSAHPLTAHPLTAHRSSAHRSPLVTGVSFFIYTAKVAIYTAILPILHRQVAIYTATYPPFLATPWKVICFFSDSILR